MAEEVKLEKGQKPQAAAKAPTRAFSKSQILKSKKYAPKQDALSVLLKEDVQYTHAQVDKLLKGFYKGGKK